MPPVTLERLLRLDEITCVEKLQVEFPVDDLSQALVNELEKVKTKDRTIFVHENDRIRFRPEKDYSFPLADKKGDFKNCFDVRTHNDAVLGQFLGVEIRVEAIIDGEYIGPAPYEPQPGEITIIGWKEP